MKEDAAANAHGTYTSAISLLGGLLFSLFWQKEKNIWTLLADHKHEREMPPLRAAVKDTRAKGEERRDTEAGYRGLPISLT